MRKLGSRRGSNVIAMIHRQENIGLFGIPFYRFISVEDSERVIRAIRRTPPDKPIDLILHTPGGLVLAATQIAKAIKFLVKLFFQLYSIHNKENSRIFEYLFVIKLVGCEDLVKVFPDPASAILNSCSFFLSFEVIQHTINHFVRCPVLHVPSNHFGCISHFDSEKQKISDDVEKLLWRKHLNC